MQAKQTTLSALEERLAGPDGAAVQKKLLTDLSALQERLARQLAGPMAKAEFAQAAASFEAVKAAQTVVQRWVPCAA